VCAVGGHYANTLQVGLELPAGDTGDFGTHTAEVLSLAADGYRVAHLGAFATDFTLPSHRLVLKFRLVAMKVCFQAVTTERGTVLGKPTNIQLTAIDATVTGFWKWPKTQYMPVFEQMLACTVESGRMAIGALLAALG
jgi:hypothetical protein